MNELDDQVNKELHEEYNEFIKKVKEFRHANILIRE